MDPSKIAEEKMKANILRFNAQKAKPHSFIGWYKMHRGWMENPAFRNEPYTEREAWEWLIASANFKQGLVRYPGGTRFLFVGQLSHSQRFMAGKFQWNLPRLHRYLKKLEKWNMIETAEKAQQTVITIVKYGIYQNGSDE